MGALAPSAASVMSLNPLGLLADVIASSSVSSSHRPCSDGLGDRPINPRHQGPQPLADLFDLVLFTRPPQPGEVRPAIVVLGHPFLGESAILDLVENLAHLGFYRRGNHSRTTSEVAILSGVTARVALTRDTTLIDQI